MGAGCCDSKPFGEPCGGCAFDEPATPHASGDSEYTWLNLDAGAPRVGSGYPDAGELIRKDDLSRLQWAALAAESEPGLSPFWSVASFASEFYRGRNRPDGEDPVAAAVDQLQMAGTHDFAAVESMEADETATHVSAGRANFPGVRPVIPGRRLGRLQPVITGGGSAPAGEDKLAGVGGAPFNWAPRGGGGNTRTSCCCKITRVGYKFVKSPSGYRGDSKNYMSILDITVRGTWVKGRWAKCKLFWAERTDQAGGLGFGDKRVPGPDEAPSRTQPGSGWGAWSDLTKHVVEKGGAVGPDRVAPVPREEGTWHELIDSKTEADCSRLLNKPWVWTDRDTPHASITRKVQIWAEFYSGCGPVAILPIFTHSVTAGVGQDISPKGRGSVGGGQRGKAKPWDARPRSGPRKKPPKDTRRGS